MLYHKLGNANLDLTTICYDLYIRNISSSSLSFYDRENKALHSNFLQIKKEAAPKKALHSDAAFHISTFKVREGPR